MKNIPVRPRMGCRWLHERFSDEEVELMAQMSLRARRPLNWNVLTVDSARPDDYKNQIDACERVADKGGRAMALTMPILVGMTMHFHSYCALTNSRMG